MRKRRRHDGGRDERRMCDGRERGGDIRHGVRAVRVQLGALDVYLHVRIVVELLILVVQCRHELMCGGHGVRVALLAGIVRLLLHFLLVCERRRGRKQRSRLRRRLLLQASG